MPIDTLSDRLSSAAAPRRSLQEQATRLQSGLMTEQPSSLRTSVVGFSSTKAGAEKSVFYCRGKTGFVEGKDPILLEIGLNDASGGCDARLVRWRIQFIAR